MSDSDPDPSPPRARSRRSRWAFRLVALGVTLAVIFGCIEVVFRMVAAQVRAAAPMSWARADEVLGYRLNPRHEWISADAMRDDPVTPKDGRFRILMLGDSVGFNGDTAQDTFVGRLEARLAADPDLTPTDVLNSCTKGYTHYQELLYLEHHGIGYEPDLVGVAFVLNDLHRFLHTFVVEDGEIVGESYAYTREAMDGVDAPAPDPHPPSLFVAWLQDRAWRAKLAVKARFSDEYVFDVRPDLYTAWREESWPVLEEQQARMKALGEEHGFPVFVVAFPYGAQYREDYLARDREYVMLPQRKLKEICERLDVPLLDLYPLLDPDEDLVADGVHLSAAGRAKTAELIHAFLKDEGLLPRK